jgi:hypothetical protein
LKEARSRLLGWKFLHINTHKQASPVAGIKIQRYRRKLFLTYCQNNKIVSANRMKFSHINSREIHPAYQAVSLSGPARFPYKQTLRTDSDEENILTILVILHHIICEFRKYHIIHTRENTCAEELKH